MERLDEGVDVRVGDAFGNTLLHWAASRNALPLATALLARHADANQANTSTAHTPLHWAAAGGHAAMALALLDGGADACARDALGRDALFYAVANAHEPVAHLLLLRGAEVDAQDNGGNTALHWAAHGGSVALAHMLLSAGFSPHVKNNTGDTALHVCARGGHVDAFRALLRAGAALHEENAAEQSVEAVATGDVQCFLTGTFARKPQNYLRRRPWTMRLASLQAVVTAALYAGFAGLLHTYGWVSALAFFVLAVALVRYSGQWPARDERNAFWHVYIVAAHWANLTVWILLVRSGTTLHSMLCCTYGPAPLPGEILQSQLYLFVAVLVFLASQYLVWNKADPGFIETTPEDDAEAFYADLRRGITEFRICPTCRVCLCAVSIIHNKDRYGARCAPSMRP